MAVQARSAVAVRNMQVSPAPDAAGIVIAPVAPASPDQANWTISAVKYGKAPKAECDDELTRIAPLFLRHFNIAAESPPAEGEAAADSHQADAAEEVTAA